MNEWMDKEDAHSVCMCVCVFDCNIFQRTCSLQVQEIAVRLTLLPHTVNRKYHYLANKGSLVMITYALLHALLWNPQEKRERGRPRNPWRSGLDAEVKVSGHYFGTAGETCLEGSLESPCSRGPCPKFGSRCKLVRATSVLQKMSSNIGLITKYGMNCFAWQNILKDPYYTLF